MPAGRPSSYTPEIADEICRRLAGGESLRAICRDDGMPHAETIRRWLADDKHPGFRGQYARARSDQARGYAEEVVEIADTEEDPQRARVRIDARKWVASKLLPKAYGERVALEHSGPDGGPVPVTLVDLVTKAADDDDSDDAGA